MKILPVFLLAASCIQDAAVSTTRSPLPGAVCDQEHEGEERSVAVGYGGYYVHFVETCTALHRADQTVYAHAWVVQRLP